MTIQELIVKLSSYDPTLPVCYYGTYPSAVELQEVYEDNKYFSKNHIVINERCIVLD